MKWNKWCKLLLGCFAFALLFSGCATHSSEGLYALPRQSDAYYDLQNAIDQVLTSSTAYAGPLTGSNQQSVQLVDLDGDGEDEAVAFLKTTGELPLKACIFDRSGESYVNTAVIEGDGSGFDAVEYAQIDGEPGMEIVLGRRLSDQIVQSLAVYTCREGQMVELMTCNYAEFQITDLDADERKDIFVLRLETEERAGVAELYSWRDGHMERAQEANMSVGAKQIKRIITGSLEGHVPAVFVASAYEEDTIITDIFAFRDASFCNVATGGELGVSAQTVRNYNVYATDIDADGVIELPKPVALPSFDAGEETQWAIEWYSLSADGEQKMKKTTYHNYAGGWYVELPEQWRDRVSVSRNTSVPGVTAYSISKWLGYDRKPQEIFTIYAFTGEDRLQRSDSDGRFLLTEKGETAYAASFGTCDWAQNITREELTAMFHFIYLDWNSGET